MQTPPAESTNAGKPEEQVMPAIGGSDPAVSGDVRDSEHLDRTLVRGVAWTAGVKWATMILTWSSMVIVARVLTPGDFGLVAMATVFTSLIEMISDFGMGQAIIKHRELTRHQIAQINGLCVMLGIAGCALTWLAAYPLSLVFGEHVLVAIVMTLGVNFLVISFRSVPLSLLQRDLEFRSVAMNEGIQAILQSVAMVTLALLGYGYWSLVMGTILGGVVSTLLALRLRPTPLVRPTAEIGKVMTFGSHMVVLRICWYLTSSADVFIAGKVLGSRLLGAYSMAMTISAIPLEKLAALVMRVMPSVLSAVQDDSAALRRYILRFTEAVTLVTFPATVGLSLVADDFVRFVLGEKWIPAILPLQLLSLAAGYRSTLPIFPTAAAIIGLSGLTMRVAVAGSFIMPVGFLVGSKWGIGGIAACWFFLYPITAFPYYYLVFSRINMRSMEYLRSLWPAASSTAFMAVMILLCHRLLYPDWPVVLRMSCDILVGILAYPLFLLAMHRERVNAQFRTFRLLRSK